MRDVRCTNCQQGYPDEGVPYRCPTCGGIYDFHAPFNFEPGSSDSSRPGIWRHPGTLSRPEFDSPVSLGEGDTPLIWARAFDRQIGFKLEYLNPTGSFKDRATSPAITFLRNRGVSAAVEDSSGNAGASFAAYAARAGVAARVFVPDSASGPKRAQIEAYGAELVRVLGPRSNAAEAVRQAADEGAVYASHVYLPFGLAGLATAAYELWEQLDGPPGTVLSPVGHGSLLLGLARGFDALLRAGLIDRVPRLVGVQAHSCAPLWAVFAGGPAGLGWVSEGQTVAEGIRTKHPVRGDAVLAAVRASRGAVLTVHEDAILDGRDRLAGLGLFVEPTSAVVWDALRQLGEVTPEPVVVMLTGTGFKAVP